MPSSRSSPTCVKLLPEPEPITLKQIRDAIPAHCFERTYFTPFYYLFLDLVYVGVLLYAGTYIDNLIPSLPLRILAWIIYGFILGSPMTGLWILGHECGHQAFGPSLWINNAVGCILHTSLFVPYWSWKHSHAHHHANTNSMDRDSVYVPVPELKNARPQKFSLIRQFGGLVAMVLFGWWAYLWVNVISAQSLLNCHYNPFCSLWKNRTQRIGVIASDIALVVWCWILYQLSLYFGGWTTLIKFYFVPLLWVKFWIVTYTFLHHTDSEVAKLYDPKWSWLRGALGTVDRDYGTIFNFFHHHIGDTHVVHHLFSKIPFYHAQEATKALVDSGLLKDYYIIEKTPWYMALWYAYDHFWYGNHDEPFIIENTKKTN